MDKKPIVLNNNGLVELANGETLSIDADHHSGASVIQTGTTLTIGPGRQMIIFAEATFDGTINLDGDLWLA